MGKRKYDETQQEALWRLERLHEQHIEAKITLKRKIEEEYAKRLRSFEYEESRLMNECLRLVNSRGVGISKRDIGLAVGTQHWPTLQEKYALASEDFGPRFESKKFEFKNYAFRTVAALLDRPAAAVVSRFDDWTKIDLALYIEEDGFLTIDGDIPQELSACLYGIPGPFPENDRHPLKDVVDAWNELVAHVAETLGRPEAAAWNALPHEMQFADNGARLTPLNLFERAKRNEF